MPDRIGAGRQRRAIIEEILRQEEIHNQLELLKRLRRKGFRVTQPSVSRDLAELQVVKVGGRYLPGDALGGAAVAERAIEGLAGSILSCAAAGPYMLVVKTPPGAAGQIALAIDHARWPEIVGTVAGDDTLFIATNGRRAQSRAMAVLNRLQRERVHV